MSAVARLFERFQKADRPPALRVLAASGQLGYGIPEEAFKRGLEQRPDFIGCDMGSIDPGPYYLGAGRMATSPEVTRRDLRMVLAGARRLNVPLIIGTAGTAGAAPHLEETLGMVQGIAQEEGLSFRLASIRADIPHAVVKAALRDQRLHTLGAIPELDDVTIDACTHLVGQMSTEAIVRAVQTGADVVVAGRACDTAVFAAIPSVLGYPMGEVMHMAKIIECTSICCTPGGRDAILAVLDEDGFTLDSMHPGRHATPMSIAAHSLYEQEDPFSVREPEGTLRVDQAVYEKVDEHRTRVHGGRWEQAPHFTVKIEGAAWEGERAIVVAGSADPDFIDAIDGILPQVEEVVRSIVPGSYRLFVRVYGCNGVLHWPTPPVAPPREIFILGECIADTIDKARSAIAVFKQYLLHHGFPGRLCTAGNIAFPFTPPEMTAASAYRFAVYHVMDVDELAPLFPVEVATVGQPRYAA